MQQLTKAKMHDESFVVALVADAELFRLEGAIRWLDMAEARLARGDRVESGVHGVGQVEETSTEANA